MQQAADESVWIRQIAAGDREAFERLYRAYQRRVFGYCYRMVGDVSAAEEITNDCLVEVWKRAGTFRGESRPSTWIFGIAHYKALNALRAKEPERADFEEARGLAGAEPSPEETMVARSIRKDVQQALARLSKEHREVTELTFYHGFSYPEIATILKVPVNTVKTRMFHARKQLAATLRRFA